MPSTFFLIGITALAIIIIALVVWIVWVVLHGQSTMIIKSLNTEPIQLDLGVFQQFRIGFSEMIGMMYCGMPSEKVYSMTCSLPGIIGSAANVYFPREMEGINIGWRDFTVLDVTPERISLQYCGTSRKVMEPSFFMLLREKMTR